MANRGLNVDRFLVPRVQADHRNEAGYEPCGITIAFDATDDF
jgi:hypothetical protein